MWWPPFEARLRKERDGSEVLERGAGGEENGGGSDLVGGGEQSGRRTPKQEMLVKREVLERGMPETCQAQTTREPNMEETSAKTTENKHQKT